MSEWISVEDQLPEKDIMIIVFDGVVHPGAYSDEEGNRKFWKSVTDDSGSWWEPAWDATHWMPLPKEPK